MNDVTRPGWHPDPWYDGQHRWWDGDGWTADVFPDGPVAAAGSPTVSLRAQSQRPAAPPPSHHAATMPPPPDWTTWSAAKPAPLPVAEVLAAPTANRSLRDKAIYAIVLVVGGVIGFVAVDAATGNSSSKPAAVPTPTPVVPTPGSSPPSAADQQLLQSLVVRQQDVPASYVVRLIPNGTDARSQPTLDLCNGTFPSESLRTARLQVAEVAADSSVPLSTEAVAYRSSTASVQAFQELASTAAHCPKSPVISPVGEPTVTTTFGPAPDRGWRVIAGVQRLAFRFTSTDDTGTAEDSVAVYLRRGHLLEGLYFPQSAAAALSVDGKAAVADVVRVFEQRLADLPAGAVGG
jgi:hypothetical protein